MVKAKKFIYAEEFDGEPKLENFRLEEEQLPKLENGEVLFEALFLSVDPYMRPYMSRFPVGATMLGSQIARVSASRHGDYEVESLWLLYPGWRSHTIYNPTQAQEFLVPVRLPDLADLPVSLSLGALGMPGNTAYFGFLEICQPKPGDTVVVTAAAGAVGSLVGQIAKIKGCTVIGFAGSEEKVRWLKELGFDFAFNYKSEDIHECLKKSAPNGIDCYFDNVGGVMSQIVLEHMKDFGRISICGSISTYNEKGHSTEVQSCQTVMVLKQLKMEGFIVTRWKHRFPEAFTHMSGWIREGKIKYRETIVNGFENLPTAFMDMMKGKNTGKMIVKA